jgi:iron(III)-salmochelin esterase
MSGERAPRLSRRALLVGTAAAACSKKEPPASVVAPSSAPVSAPLDAGMRGSSRLVTMTFDADAGGPQTAAILVPTWGPEGTRFPVVVALHGRGEALKGPDRGAFGWPTDYALGHAIERIASPPVTPADLEGFSDDARLAQLNADLAARPFGGVIVACPYVPDLDLRTFKDMRAYGKWIVETFLPRVRRETPAIVSIEATGIDGVSLGGATALRVGFSFPEAFGAVGALQPAIADDQAQEWTDLARYARKKRPSMALRLTTSHDDYYNAAVTHLSQAWRAGGVEHDFADVPGPHDYAFNRGPGAYELLAWHDRVLRRK